MRCFVAESHDQSPPVRRAILSVSDKSGLVDLARGLVRVGVEIYSTGGTRQHLEAAGLAVRDIAAYTGFPEMMHGRLKTLHPKIFGGILCRHDEHGDMAALREHAILSFELVVVNLYPFQATVARPGVTLEEAIEQIDIGGPSLVRAAAKNHAFTTVATQPAQYPTILEQISSNGRTTLELRRRLAREAFAHTARYDCGIADYLEQAMETSEFPPTLRLELERLEALRYGENPHQKAAVYAWPGGAGGSLVRAKKLNGKELSYNNLLDLHSALAIVRGLSGSAASVIKHNNPCGAATADSLADAAQKALDGDPLSAFGSVLGFNRRLDAATAEVLVQPGRFIEAVVAPGYDAEALSILTTRPKWRENVRLLEIQPWEAAETGWEYRTVDGGLLVQEPDVADDPEAEWQVVTERKPDDALRAELRFAWSIVRHVKSNAIAVCRNATLLGAGAGQMSRVDSVEIALKKAGERARGAVLSSDAFFPFPDSIHHAAAAGIAAVIQPGGSKKDNETIAACNEHGLPMIFTGRRHFKH